MFLISYVLTTREIAIIDTLSSLLYNERFSEFERRLEKERKELDTLVWSALKLAYLEFYMTDNNTDSLYEDFVSLMDYVLRTYGSNREKSTREKMILASVMAIGTVFFGRRRNIGKAIALGEKAFKLYVEAYKEDTTVYDALLPIGLYDFAMGYLSHSPSRKRKGIDEIKKVTKKGILAKPLSYAALVYVYIFDKKPGKAVHYALKALSMYPKSRTFRWVLAKAYLEAAMYDKAYKTYNEIRLDLKSRNPSCKVCMAEVLYYMGESLYKSGKKEEAKKPWYQAIWYLEREKDPYRRRKVEEIMEKLKKRIKL